jgi:hypothetical protein
MTDNYFEFLLILCTLCSTEYCVDKHDCSYVNAVLRKKNYHNESKNMIIHQNLSKAKPVQTGHIYMFLE